MADPDRMHHELIELWNYINAEQLADATTNAALLPLFLSALIIVVVGFGMCLSNKRADETDPNAAHNYDDQQDCLQNSESQTSEREANDSEPDGEPDSESDSEPDSEPDSEAGSGPDSEAGSGPDNEPDNEPDTKQNKEPSEQGTAQDSAHESDDADDIETEIKAELERMRDEEEQVDRLLMDLDTALEMDNERIADQ